MNPLPPDQQTPYFMRYSPPSYPVEQNEERMRLFKVAIDEITAIDGYVGATIERDGFDSMITFYFDRSGDWMRKLTVILAPYHTGKADIMVIK